MAEIPPESVSQGGYLVRIEDRQKLPELRAQSVPGAGKYGFQQFIFGHRPEKAWLYPDVFGERGQRLGGFCYQIVE